jgi:thiamine-monophosphate kinase
MATVGEFELIDRYFRPLQQVGTSGRDGIVTGIGDDAAVLSLPPDRQLVAALDTLVEGVHFPAGSPAASIGHRALAVNLSDLAAMGAEPAWYLLSLTMPRVEEAWLEALAQGMHALARRAPIALVGGDTTRGPLSLSVQVLGHVAPGEALTRAGARPGDLLFASGDVGDAAAGLELELAGLPGDSPDAPAQAYLRNRFRFPTPRLSLGRALRGLASAAIDVSDGLAADAGKLAQVSGCGARIDLERLPLSDALRATCEPDRALRLALAGGDDYELCFTLPPGKLPELGARLAGGGTKVTCIGVIESTPGLRLCEAGQPRLLDFPGFDHFASP